MYDQEEEEEVVVVATALPLVLLCKCSLKHWTWRKNPKETKKRPTDSAGSVWQ